MRLAIQPITLASGNRYVSRQRDELFGWTSRGIEVSAEQTGRRAISVVVI
jgi:hypothetical protein